MDMKNTRSYPGTVNALTMRNQKLNRQGFGSLRLLIGLLFLFVIWQRCSGFNNSLNPPCPVPIERLNCKYKNYTVKVNGCSQNYCYRGLKEQCGSPDRECADDLQCTCGECMNCVGELTYYCNTDVCKFKFPLAKRLPNRLPPSWYYLSRWENLLRKYSLEPNYDDDETTQYLNRFMN